MYYLIAGQKPGKDIADRCIYGYRAQTSAYDKKYRFAGRQVGISEPGQPVTLEQFLTDRGACQYSFVRWKVLKSLRKVTADLKGGRNAYFIGQARRHIRFVYDDRDFIVLGSKNHGNCNKTALGKNYIRFMAF